MNQWCASLLLLCIIQVWFYHSSPKKILNACIFYWASIYLSLLACEFVRKAFMEFQIDWWISVVACLTALMIGESAHVLSSSIGKSIDKKRQSLPSFFSLSSLYAVLVWLNLDHFSFFFQSQVEMVTVAALSFLFLLILSGIQERLRLYEVPKYLQGLPILIVSAAIFLLICVR